MTKRLTGAIEKGWGSELIFETNDLYCGKLLNFRKGMKSSMHFHVIKDEAWYVLSGKFILKMIDTVSADVYQHELVKGSSIRIKPLQPHQLICIEEGTIVEVSTADSIDDNYRIKHGDSQL